MPVPVYTVKIEITCNGSLYEPGHEISVLNAYAQMSLINTLADISRKARGLHLVIVSK